jgi:hypothetical protein
MSKLTVYTWSFTDDEYDVHEFDGDFEVAVQPEKTLVILENVPDLLNKGGGTVKRIKAVFNDFARVEVD